MFNIELKISAMIKCKQSNSCTVGMKQYQFYFSVVISILDWLDVVAITCIIIQNVASDQILQGLPITSRKHTYIILTPLNPTFI